MHTGASTAPIMVYVDVDDTLVRSVGHKRIPIPAVIQHVRELHAQGASLYCWSAGGADYARSSVAEMGIADCFIAFLPKPNVLIDDQNISNWPRITTVHPASCDGLLLEDYRKRLS